MRHIILVILILTCTINFTSCTNINLPSKTKAIKKQSKKAETPKQKEVTKEVTSPQPRDINIALLLPITGSASKIGNALLDSAAFALFSSNVPNVKLKIYNTGSTIEKARLAAGEALTSDNNIIVGPLMSNQTQAIIPLAQEKNINIISFSNDQRLANKGIFLLGFNPTEQIKRLIQYSVTHDIKEYYTLLPANVYGTKILEVLREKVLENEAILEKTEFYQENGKNLELVVDSIAEAIKNSTSTQDNDKALLIAEGGERLKKIVSLLKEKDFDFKKIKLIGTGQWDDNSILDLGLTNAYFVSSYTKDRADLENIFEAKFNYKMPRIATLAYDAVALITTLSKHQQELNTSSLTNSVGFIGIDGIFRFNKDGIAERGLSIVGINDNKLEILDEAPTAFIDQIIID